MNCQFRIRYDPALLLSDDEPPSESCSSHAHAKLTTSKQVFYWCSHHLRVISAKLGLPLSSLPISCSDHKNDCRCAY